MNVIRDIGESLGNAVLENVGRAIGRAQERTPLPVDLLESDDAYLAVFDAPGARSSDVQVQYDDGAVEVRIDRFRGFHEGFEMRYPGRGLALDGRVELPDDATVDAVAATATLRDNGTLHVRVPKIDDPVAGDVDEALESEAEGAAGDPPDEWEAGDVSVGTTDDESGADGDESSDEGDETSGSGDDESGEAGDVSVGETDDGSSRI